MRHLSIGRIAFPSLFLILSSISSTLAFKDVSQCSCGFYDPSTDRIWSDSTIVYFNESSTVPLDDFLIQDYENQYEKGWNSQFRQGASPSNVEIGDDENNSNITSLKLFCDPSNPSHLVMGGGISTHRRDIFYGSFQVVLRSPKQYGSSLSMELPFNSTQGITLNVQTTDENSTAWVSMLTGEEFPSHDLGVNYTVLENSTNHIFPRDFTSYRVDWTEKELNYSVGDKIFRTLRKKSGNKYPQTPSPFILKHWSVGNYFSMQGPPSQRSLANVASVRIFFNSSLTTKLEKEEFNSRCRPVDACAVDDMTLRGSSPYPEAATRKWKQATPNRGSRVIPTVIVIICSCASFALTVNSLMRRMPWFGATQTGHGGAGPKDPLLQSVSPPDGISTPRTGLFPSSGISSRTESIYEDGLTLGSNNPYRFHGVPGLAVTTDADAILPAGEDHRYASSTVLPDMVSPFSQGLDNKSGRRSKNGHSVRFSEVEVARTPSALREEINEKNFGNPQSHIISSDVKMKLPSDSQPRAGLPSPKKRVDYLAGLVALSCLLVTAIHFCLTFVPAAINPGAFIHYESELWSRRTINSYFLNLIWIGPFLMTSTRFLVSNYIKNGDLKNVAEKTVGRPFRLLIPILAIALLEYFFMDSGATSWLEYLPSVTWSTWPFTTVPETFGHFISEILELAYLIPNAAPQITFNYCTGVLWTIPVQLQGSWTSLLGAIVIREIKRPWKRFSYYAVCMLMHWYALSWGTYFYLGLMLTDLDITYKYKKWINGHKLVLYALIFLSVAAGLGGLTIDAATQNTQVNYPTYEYGVHPDLPTGLPIMQTGAAGYPQYYVPKLHGIVFAFGFQLAVELSTFAQSLLSFKLLIYVFPHIFTIYLIHGFIFWSIGSMACVYLSAHGFPYWLNLVIVAICCYSTLFLSLPLLTPIVETLGRSVTNNVWIYAHQQPAPRRPTLYPYPTDFLFVRAANTSSGSSVDGSSAEKRTAKIPTPLRNAFRSLAATCDSKYNNQSNEPYDAVMTRSTSLTGDNRPRRTVGWRDGRISSKVDILKKNNRS